MELETNLKKEDKVKMQSYSFALSKVGEIMNQATELIS